MTSESADATERRSAGRRLRARVRERLGKSPAIREVALCVVLYLGYTVTRTFASDDLASALTRALHIERLEAHIDLNADWLNRVFSLHMWLGVIGDYWYASAHYVVTLGVLIWLYRKHRDTYFPARRVLVVATLIALVFYLLLPTAPPRMLPGYIDIMSLHADLGWWGADASAPRGLGGLTNELAAFPSMHAGWALWVALSIWRATRNRILRTVVVLYALGTGIVVVGTGNHWLVDVVAGQALMLIVWQVIAGPATTREAVPVPATE